MAMRMGIIEWKVFKYTVIDGAFTGSGNPDDV